MTDFKDYTKDNQLLLRLWFLVLAVLSFGLYTMAQVLFTVSKKTHLAPEKVFFIVITGISVIAIIAFLYYFELGKINDWEFNKLYEVTLKSIAIAVIGFVLILIVQLGVVSISHPHTTSNNQAILNSLLGKTNPLFYVMLGILAPISEELIFRGMFFEVFCVKASTKNMIIGVILNGLVFALLHDQKFDLFFGIYFLNGVILASEYLITKNISTSIITHMGVNILTLMI